MWWYMETVRAIWRQQRKQKPELFLHGSMIGTVFHSISVDNEARRLLEKSGSWMYLYLRRKRHLARRYWSHSQNNKTTKTRTWPYSVSLKKRSKEGATMMVGHGWIIRTCKYGW